MTPAVLALMLWALAAPQSSAASGGPDVLAAARALYAAGNYEDALTRLAQAPGDAVVGEVDEYRALCLLALGRPIDAEHTLEDLVARAPMFKMSDTEISPRLVSMYRDTRRRLLPMTARDLYLKAKTDYDQKNFATASAEFTRVLTLLGDEDMSSAASTVGDLKILAEGFATLADGEVAAAAKAAAATAAAAPAAPPRGAAPIMAPKIYTEDDTAVQAPVATSTPYPSWRPPSSAANREYHGVLRLVIDASGRVESATMVVSVSPTYDPLLVAAAKKWTFTPAQLNGVAVTYQKQIAVSLSPR
jgi:TonB family protein